MLIVVIEAMSLTKQFLALTDHRVSKGHPTLVIHTPDSYCALDRIYAVDLVPLL